MCGEHNGTRELGKLWKFALLLPNLSGNAVAFLFLPSGTLSERILTAQLGGCPAEGQKPWVLGTFLCFPPLDLGAVALGEPPGSVLPTCLPPERVWQVGLPPLGCGARMVGERMTAAASAPGPSPSEPNCFLGRLQGAGPHSLLPFTCLLSPLALEGGLEGNVGESWGLARTRESRGSPEVSRVSAPVGLFFL